MELAQIMMMPTEAAAAAAPETTSCSICPGVGTDTGFGLLLGQSLAIVQQDGNASALDGGTASGQTQAFDLPSEMALTGSGLPRLAVLSSIDLQTDRDLQTVAPPVSDKEKAQQFAGLMQAAMLMPFAVQPRMTKPDGAQAARSSDGVMMTVEGVAGQSALQSQDALHRLTAVAPQETGRELSQESFAGGSTEVQPTQKEQAHVASEVKETATLAMKNQPQPEQPLTPDPSVAKPAIRSEAATDARPHQAGAAQADTVRVLVPDVSVTPKETSPAAVAVRFAQPPDVVVATANPEQDRQQEQPHLSRGQGKAVAENGEQAAAGKEELPRFELKLTPSAHTEAAGSPWGVPVQRLSGGNLEVQVAEPARVTVEHQVMRQVTERLASHDIKPGADQISLKLSPEHLGNLQLNLRMEDQQVRVEIVAEHRAVREALLQQVDQLKESLARQNIRMESFDVTTSNNGGLTQQQNGDWRHAASDRRPPFVRQQYGSNPAAAVVAAADVPMQYFAPQYQSTLDVRF